MTQRIIRAAAVVLAIGAVSYAAAPRAGAETAKAGLSVSDVVARETVSDFVLSSGGEWAAWVKSSADSSSNRRVRTISVRNLHGETSFTFGEGKGDSYSPRFSPDGSRLAFLRKPDKGKPQIYLYDMSGGEPKRLSKSSTGVRGFEWLDDDGILFIAREDSTFRERELARLKDNTVVAADQDHYSPVRLFYIAREGGKTIRVTDNEGQIVEFSPSPDGRWIALSVNRDVNYNYDHRNPPGQYLVDFSAFMESEKTARDSRDGGAGAGLEGYAPLKEILSAPHVDPFRFEWTGSSDGFYCSRSVSSDSTDTYVSIRRLYFYSVEKDVLRKAEINDEMGLSGDYYTVDGGILLSIADGSTFKVIYSDEGKRGSQERVIEAANGGTIIPRAVSPDSEELLYTVSDASSLPLIMFGRLKRGRISGRRELCSVNSGWKDKYLARSEVIGWEGALSDNVEGILYYPRGYEKGSSYPLIVSLHGGPSGTDLDYFSERWSNYPHLLAARGSFVLKVNYHGSGNYGLDWIESIKGRYYEYEVPDILNGVDFLVESGLADPDRIGIMGWSNGSILAIQCCLESDRFKALCAGAGDVNWTSDYGNCGFGAGFDNAYFGGPPWEMEETYVSKSPLFRMEKLLTPTLIMFGTEDRSVPTEQGWEHFRAMQQIGKAPVRFILFPGAGHGPTMLSHQRRKMREELAWFDKHLFDINTVKNEALDPDSPLAMELAKLSLKMTGDHYGEANKGALVPETARFEEAAVGRFEVTRAQYACFDEDYEYPEGTGNYPASSIDFEKAKEYCRWLSGVTGRKFRLPSEEEMKKLNKKASPDPSKENNLGFWAGYQPGPGEAEMIFEEVKKIEGQRLLLKEAGSFRPAGKYYDLAGNVSEWAVCAEGKGAPFGLSALSNPDNRARKSYFDARYTGLRVWEDLED